MEKDDLEIGMLYESFVLNEGLVSSIGQKIKTGFQKGMDIFDIVAKNLNEFIAIAAVFSSSATMVKVHKMYQDHPEILQQHNEYTDRAIQDIGQFLSDNPKVLNIFLKK